MYVFYKKEVLIRRFFTALIVLWTSLAFVTKSFSQTVVSPASAIPNMCTGGTYHLLSPITVTETSASGFVTVGPSVTFVLNAPANFEFDTSVPVAVGVTSGGDLSVNVAGPFATSTSLTIDFKVLGGVTLDQFTISGLKIRALSTPASGDISRPVAGGTLVITGQAAAGSATSYGFVQSESPPSITLQPASHARCQNTSTFFTVTATGTGLTYQWQVDDNLGGGFVTANAAQYSGFNSSTLAISSVNGLNGYKYRVLVTGSCSAIATSAPDAILTVTPTPTAPVVATPPAICELGTNPTLTATSVTGTVDWFSDVALTTPVQTNSTTFIPAVNAAAGSYTYYVTQTTATCRSAATAVTVVVNPPVVANAGSDATICNGSNITLGSSPTATGGNGVFTYLWTVVSGTPLGVGLSGLSNPVVSPTVDTEYSLLVTTPGSGCSDTKNITITVTPTPTAPVVATPPAICELGTNPTLTATSVTGTVDWFSDVALTTPVQTNSTTFIPAVNAAAGSYTYYVTQTTATCRSAATAVTVVVNPPVVANAGSDATICNGSNITLGSSPTATGGNGVFTYLWTVVSGTPLGVGLSGLSNPVVSPTVDTEYSLLVTTAGSGCSDTKNITITVTPTPTAPVVATPSAICELGTNPTLTATSVTGTVDWFSDVALTTPVQTNSTTFIPAVNAAAGSYTYYVTQTTATCRSAATAVTVVVNSPVVANAGSDATICNGSNITLGSSPTATGGNGVFTYLWTVVSGTPLGVGLSGLSNPVVSPTVDTEYSLLVTTAGSGCSDTKNITITVIARPSAPVVATPSAICELGTNPLLTATSVTGTVDWYTTATLITLAQANSTTFTPAVNAAAGSYTFYVTQTEAIASCRSLPTAVTIVVNPPVVANAGSDATICNGSNVTLGGSPTATGGDGVYTYLWTVVSGTPLGVGLSGLSNPVVSPTVDTEYSLLVTTAGSGCSDTKNITITVTPTPTAPVVTTPPAICEFGTNPTLTATSVTGTVDWFSDVALTTPVQTNSTTFIPAVNAAAGSYTYYVTQTTATCRSAATAVTVVVNPPVVANAGSDATICNGSNITLGSSPTATGGNGVFTYLWTVVSGTPLGVGLSGLSNPVVSPTVDTEYSLLVTTPGSGCSDTKNITITVTPTPTAPVVATPSAICELGTNPTLTATSVTGTVDWFSDVALTTPVQTNSTTFIPAVNAAAGSYTYYVTQTIATCRSAATAVTVVVNPPVVANAGSDATICNGSNITLGSSPTATGGNGVFTYLWTVVSGTPLGVGLSGLSNPVVSPTVDTEYSLLVTTAGSGCSDTKNITITVTPTPTAPVVATPPAICELGTNPTLTATSVTGTVDWFSDVALTTPVQTNSTTFIPAVNAAAGSYTYYVTQTTATCRSAATAVTVVVNPPVVANAGSDATICNGSNITLGSSPTATGGNGVFTYLWTVISGTPLGVGLSGLSNPVVSPTVDTEYSLLVTTPGSGCSDTKNITITVTPTPTAPVVATPPAICELGTNPTLTATSVTGTVDWFSDVALTTPVQTNSTTFIPAVNAAAGSYTYYVTQTTATCRSAATAVTVVVNPPVVANAGSDATICNGSNITLGSSPTATGGNGVFTYLWTVVSGTPLGVGLSGLSNPVVSPTVDTEYSLLVTTPGSGCSDTKNITITVNPIPVLTPQANISACSGKTQLSIPFVTNVDPVTSYNWSITNAASIGVTASGTSGSIPGWTYLTNVTGADIIGVATVTATKNGCTSAPMTFSITLKAQPVLTNPGPLTYCAGQAVSVVWVTNTPGSVVTWSNDNAAIGLGLGPNSGDISFTAATNTTGVPIVGNITATASRNGCVSAVQNFTISIKPTPVITQQADLSACPGASQVAIPLVTNADPVTTYSWSITNAASIGVTASGTSGSIPGWTYLTNVTGADIIGVATVTATKNGCTSAPMTFSITLKAQPVLTNPGPLTFCAGQAVSVVWVTNTPGSVVTWSNDNAAIGLGVGPSSGDISFTAATNTTGVPIVGNITATASRNGCVSAVQNFTISIKPTPVITQQADLSACPGASQVAIPLVTNADPVTTYSWSITNAASIGVTASGTSGSIPGWTYLTNVTGADIIGVATVTATKNGCTSAPMTFSITLKAQPVLTNPGPLTFCAGQAVSVVWVTNTPGSVVTWSNDNAAIGLGVGPSSGDISFTAATNTTGVPIVGNITATASRNGCVSAVQNFTISIKPTPVITQQADLSACPGASQVAIPLVTNADPVTTYSWSITNAASIGVTASGTSGSIPGWTYLTNVTGADIIGVATVTATKNGCTSAPMTFSITLKAQPVLTNPGPLTFCAGQAVSVVWVTNTPGSVVTWSNDNAAIGLGLGPSSGDISFTAATNTTGVPIVGNITATASRNGCVSAVQNFTISIKPTPVITQQADLSACPGASQVAIPLVTNADPVTTYSWSITNAASIGVTASGTSASIPGWTYLTNATGADIIGVATVTATKNGCTSAPMTFSITLKAQPVLTNPGPLTYCAGQAVSVVWVTNTPGSVVTWSNDNAAIGLGLGPNSGDISFTAATNTTGVPIVGNITATASRNGCMSAVQNFTISIKPTPVINQQANIIACPGSTQPTITFGTNADPVTGYTWNITNAALLGVSPSGTFGNIPGWTFAANTTGADIVGLATVTAFKNGCNSAPMTFSITLKAQPVLTNPGPLTFCAGQAVSVVWVTNTPGSVVTWSNDNAAIGLGLGPNSGDISFTAATNTTGVPIVGNITATASRNGCMSAVQNFTISIKPTPVITQQVNLSACPGASQGAIPLVTNADPVTTYSWSITNAASIGVSASGTSASIPGWTYLPNVTGSDIIGVVTATATKNGCSSAPMTFTISLKAQPVLSAQTDVTYCPGQAVSIPFVSNASPSSITWTNSNTAIGIPATGAGDLNFTAPPNNTPSNVSGNIVVLASKNGCVSTPLNFTITIRPSPQFTISNTTPNICEGTPVDITLNSITSGAVMTLTGLSYGGGSGTPIALGTTFTNGQKITESISNPLNTAITVVYTFSVAANTCSNPVTQSTSVVVKPNPTANGSNAVICSGQNAFVLINGSPENVPGTTFDWTVSASANVVGALAGNGSTINQPLTLTNSVVGTVQYQITPTANSCLGPIKNITVTINPVATVDAGVDYQVCEPVTIPLSGTIGGAASTGTWVVVTGAGSVSGSATTGSVVTATYTVNATDITNTIVLRLQTNDPDGAGPCNPVSDLLNIQINRKPTAVVPIDYVVCEPVSFASSPISLTGTIGGSATNGLWSVVTGAGGLSATNVSGTTVAASYVISAADVGTTITFRMTSNDPDGLGPCTTSFDDINIQINPRAIVSAGPDLALCRNNPSIALQGSKGPTTTVLWTGGTGSYSNSASPTSNYIFNPATEVGTTFTLTLTAADPDGAGPCSTVADQMLLTINPLPLVNIFGLPTTVAENVVPFVISGSQAGGLFTIAPTTSSIGATSVGGGGTDEANFDPSAVELGFNTVTYSYTNPITGCQNSVARSILVNPVTTLEFTLQNCPLGTSGPCTSFIAPNGSGEFEICSGLGLLRLFGNPEARFGFPITNFVAIGPNAAIIQAKISSLTQGGPSPDWYLDTDGLPSDTYFIQYNYTNSVGDASDPVTKTIKVFATPNAVISNALNNCISGPINFVDGSTIQATPYPTTITGWRWDFKDGTIGNTQNPSHVYATAGTFNVELTVTTGQGCNGHTSLPIRVGDVPVVDFDWSAICTNDRTTYLDKTNPGAISTITQYTWDFGDGDILTGAAGATVPVGTHGGRTTGTFKDPLHNFVVNGTYTTKLIIDTDDLCTNSKFQSVFILPAGSTVAPSPAVPYLADFEANDFGWISEGLKVGASPPGNNSWAYGSLTGATITSSGRAWWTSNGTDSPATATYFFDEQSAVNGPCFDLTLLKRPMIAMDYWSDAEKNLDGAALQYSVNGGITWNIVGPPASSPNEGINWYNGQIVQSNPGQQPFGSNGWTDKIGGWKNARFHLDMVPVAQRGQVRLRVAFSSNGTNTPGPKYDGFAFDNVYVGDKQRNVLVEHFTNSSLSASVDGDTWINNLYQDQITFRGTSDFNDVQYHIAYPGVDQLNQDNLTDPAVRAATFGISQSPASVMDGILNSQFKGKYTDITRVEIDRRALNDPLFDLQLENVATTDNNLISVKLTMTARKAFSAPLIAQVILVENQVGTFKNVMRKQLFGSGGETITLPFAKGDILVKSQTDVVINVPITNSSQTKLVAYIQDKNTREIYQSIVIPILAPFKTGQFITGIENPETTPSTLNGITVHPNPASDKVYLNLPDNRSAEGFSWKLIDQRGVTLKSGEFDGMIGNNKQIDISGYANGVYIIALIGPGKSVVYQKLVILNGN